MFNRKFWENPDYNEPDLSAAYRKKSEKERIKLRPKVEIHKKKLSNGERARDNTIKYALEDLLPSLFMREAQKQAIDKVKNQKFDLQYEAMCKERGVVSKFAPQEKKPMSFFQPQNWKDHLELKIKLPQPPPLEDFNGPLNIQENTGKRNNIIPQVPFSTQNKRNQ